MDYGHIELHIEDTLRKRGISKNRLCKDLDIPRTNLNRYCRNDFQRLDCGLLCKLCHYLELNVSDLIEYIEPSDDGEDIDINI